MGDWEVVNAMGHWTVGAMRSQHHIMEISGDVTDAGRTDKRQGKIVLPEMDDNHIILYVWR